MPQRRLPPYRVSLAGTLLGAREAVMNPIRPFLRDAGVTEQQWRVLRVLADEPDLDPTGLANQAMLYAPSVTRILKELVDRDLLLRSADPDDRRRSTLRLTAAGQLLVDRTASHTLEILRAYDARFGSDRLSALRQELLALTEAIADCPIPLGDTDKP